MQVRISDYLWFQEGPGVRNTQYTQTGVKLLNVGNLVDGKVELSNTSRYISEEEAYGRYKHFLVDEGDLIIASSGIKISYFNEKMGFVRRDQLPLCMNTSTIRFKALDPGKVNIRYFMYYLKSDQFKTQLERQITGSAQLNFGPSHLKKMTMPMTELAKQDAIVAELDCIEEVIAARRLQLKKLDELLKTRFVELFGERSERDTVKLSTLAEVITKGTTPTTLGFAFTETGINFIKIESITGDGKFNPSKMAHISDSCNQKLKRSVLQEDDVLFSIAGAIGRTAIVTKEVLPANTNQALAIIRLKKDCGLNLRFLHQMLQSPLIEKQIDRKKTGAAQINLSLTDVGAFDVIVPPLEAQEQFAAFAEELDKIKSAIRQSIEKLDTMKKALLQKYFG